MDANEAIRVLIVDSDPETREKTRQLFKDDKAVEVIGVARTGKDAIDLAQVTEPDVVILDVNLPDVDEITVTESICRRVPFAQIVILSVQVDPGYMRQAMLAGARDFIVKPPSSDELRSAVYRAGGLAQERRSTTLWRQPQVPGGIDDSKTRPVSRGKVIVVYSAKGGIGCTTLAANLAIALHSKEKRAVLVDGDLQYGDVAVFTNEVGYHSILDLIPRVNDLDPDVVDTVVVNHGPSGLGIMVAPNRPELADKISGEDFFKVLQFLRRMYSYVVVDTTTDLNDVTVSALDAADMFVLLTTQEISSIKNTRLFLSTLDSLHIDRNQVMLVLNKYDKRVAISPEKIAENLKQEVVSVIQDNPMLAVRAANQGMPFVLSNKNEPISKSVFDLAERVRAHLAAVEKAEAQPAPGPSKAAKEA